MFFSVFVTIGLVYIGGCILQPLYGIWIFLRLYFLRRREDLSAFYTSMGKWAVITGATAGVGREYALKLAQCGMEIVLISRSEIKLEQLSTEIEQKYNVKTKIITVDFSHDQKIFDLIEEGLNNLDIGVLVNNVGECLPGYIRFLDIPDIENRINRLIRINCFGTTMMTSLVLPGMVKKKKGVVINVGSYAGVLPHVFYSLYAATKAYVRYLSNVINLEYADHGIIVQTLVPLILSTQMTKHFKATILYPDAKTYVESSFYTIGRASETAGYWVHDALAPFLPFLQLLDKFARKRKFQHNKSI